MESESISHSSPSFERPNNEGEIILGLVPDEDWICNTLWKKEDREIEKAERAIIDSKRQCEQRSEAKGCFPQQTVNGRSCAITAVRGDLTVFTAETFKSTERKLPIAGHYHCTSCSLVFCDSLSILKHSRTHPPTKRPFACNICGTEFTMVCNLNRHIRHHTGEASFTCSICKKMFHSRKVLKIHMHIHSGKSPNVTEDALSKYRCQICSRPFVKEEHLKKHLHIHLKEKRFMSKNLQSNT